MTYSDGSRLEGHTVAATISQSEYLRKFATVMDAEMLGIALAWKHHKTVAADSQGAIERILELQHTQAKSWIEQEVIRAQGEEVKEITWVKGHSGEIGNEIADFKAKEAAIIGRLQHRQSIATPAGIRQMFKANRITKE